MQYKIFLIVGLCILVIVLFVCIYVPGYSRYQELRREEARLIQRIEQVRTENEKLSEEIERLKTDVTHLEKVLRDEMGLVKPGEVIYKVVEEEMPTENIPDTNSHE